MVGRTEQNRILFVVGKDSTRRECYCGYHGCDNSLHSRKNKKNERAVVDSTSENVHGVQVSTNPDECGQGERSALVPSKRVSRYQLSSDGGSGIGGRDPIESRADGYDDNDDGGSALAASAAP